jgi:hypothetical protein
MLSSLLAVSFTWAVAVLIACPSSSLSPEVSPNLGFAAFQGVAVFPFTRFAYKKFLP